MLNQHDYHIDFIEYDDDTGWLVGNDYRGHAVELIHPSLDNNDPSNF